MLDYEYLSKIKSLVALHTTKKTSNILDGEFKSIYRGRSLDFDDLREYAPGDNVKDIDWKSSSKTGKVLIRRYVAEKKHNVLFVVDSGSKMHGDTMHRESKSQVATSVMGTIAYLVDKHGDDTALLQNTAKGCDFTYFSTGSAHFENMMAHCEKNLTDTGEYSLAGLLDYAAENIRRKTVMFVITDIDGLYGIEESLVKKLTVNNDVLVVNIDDVYYTGEDLYDMDKSNYPAEFMLKSRRLLRAERKLRTRIYDNAVALFNRYGISMVSVSRESDIVERVIELLEKHRNENIG